MRIINVIKIELHLVFIVLLIYELSDRSAMESCAEKRMSISSFCSTKCGSGLGGSSVSPSCYDHESPPPPNTHTLIHQTSDTRHTLTQHHNASKSNDSSRITFDRIDSERWSCLESKLAFVQVSQSNT